MKAKTCTVVGYVEDCTLKVKKFKTTAEARKFKTQFAAQATTDDDWLYFEVSGVTGPFKWIATKKK